MYSDKILKMSIGALLLALSASPSHALDFKVKYDSSLAGVSEDFKSVLEDSLVTVGSYIHAPYSVYLNIKAGNTNGAVAEGGPDYKFVLTNSIVNFRALAGEITVDQNKLSLLKNGTFNKAGLAVIIKHELLHVLGVTNNVDSFNRKSKVVGSKVQFTGINVKAVSGGKKVYLSKDLSHFINRTPGKDSPDFPTAVAPSGGEFSTFDLAVLADIGYPINRTEAQKKSVKALPAKDYSANAPSNQSFMGKRPSKVERVNWKNPTPACASFIGKPKAPSFLINMHGGKNFLVKPLVAGCPVGNDSDLFSYVRPDSQKLTWGKAISSKVTYAQASLKCRCLAAKNYVGESSAGAIFKKSTAKSSTRATGSSKIMNGDLIRADTSPRVYLVVEGERRWIPDQRRFFHMGYVFSDVAVLKEAEVKKVPVGLPLSYNGLQSGDFIRIKEKNVTYVFSDGALHKLADMHVFWSSWPNDNYLMDLKQADIADVPVSNLVIGPVKRP